MNRYSPWYAYVAMDDERRFEIVGPFIDSDSAHQFLSKIIKKCRYYTCSRPVTPEMFLEAE